MKGIDKMNKDYMIRTIAFIDILGFKIMVQNEKAHIISQVLDDLHKCAVLEDKKSNYNYISTLEIAYFSDSIVLSCDNSNDYGFIQNLMNLQIELMRKGIYVRGCMTKGELYHKDNYIFGPALIAAYEEEAKLAKYPRIILGKNYNYEGTYFCKDYDGLYFIDPFRNLQNREWNEEFNMDLAIREIVTQLDNNIKLYESEKEVLMKFIWLKQIIDEAFYKVDNKYKYFWSSNSTYDRSETLRMLRNTLINKVNNDS